MPPTPLPSDPRPPEDFAGLLATQTPVLLVGGQAVNLWALHYESRTRALAPFVSRDVDVLGDRELLEELGRVAGRKPIFFPMRPPSPEVGAVMATEASGAPLVVKVLRYLRGTTDEELRDPVYRFQIGDGTIVEVPGPIALLRAKLANLAQIRQVNRQDARHVRILASLMPAYLADLRGSAANGRMKERKLLGLLETLLEVVKSDAGKRAWVELQIQPKEFFAELDPAGLPTLQRFLEKRLPRVLG